MQITTDKYPFTIYICFIWSIITAIIIALGIEGLIRIFIGLPIIFFIPGYLLLFALFPEGKVKKEIDEIERFALSLGISIAIVPFFGVILNYTPWGITLGPILIFLEIFIFLIGILAIYRWYKTPKSKRYIFKLNIKIPKTKTKLDKILTIIIVFLFIIASSLFIYILIMPKPIEKVTAFYLLGPFGEVADYPNTLSVGENASLIIGIENHEERIMNYSVEIWLVNQSQTDNVTVYHNMWFMDKFNVTLDSVPLNVEDWQPQWEKRYDFNISRKGYFKLAFLLYFDSAKSYTKGKDYRIIAKQKIDEELTSSYKNVYIWLNVE